MPKILCLTNHDLDGRTQGAVLRAKNVFKLLARLGEVHVVLAGFHDQWGAHPAGTCGGFPLLRKVKFKLTNPITPGDRLRHQFAPRFTNMDWVETEADDRAWLEKIMPDYDLIWIHGVNIANRFGRWHWPRTVLDIDDIPSEYYRSQQRAGKSLKARLKFARWHLLWRRHEKKLHERFVAICVCSQPDHAKLGCPEKTFVIPNGFDQPVRPALREPAQPSVIGFIGNFEYEPNRLGSRWFVDQVWPLIRKKNPAAQLHLAGARSDEQKWPPDQNIQALGWLADAETEMSRWSVSVVPILTGGGTRIKIAEAFSRRCPLVSTSLGAYGYEVTDGRELFLANAPEDFAAKCLRLMEDPALGRAMTNAAWDKFIRLWTWDAQAERVAVAAHTVLAAPAGH